MSNPNPFADLYKTYSNAQLLEILDMAEHYQPEAVQVAEDELKSRNLNQDDLRSAANELERKKLGPLADIESVQGKETATEQIKNILWPDNPSEKKISRRIYIFSAFFALISFELVLELRGVFSQRNLTADPLDIFELAQVVLTGLTIVSTVLFFLRKKAGWILFFNLFCLILCGSVASVVNQLLRQENLMLLIEYAFIIIPTAALIAFLLHKPLRTAYNITKLNIAATIAVSLILLVSFLSRVM